MTHTVIIGAGPAGLATATCLKMRGLDSTLLERGQWPASGLRALDPKMTLLSPTRFSRLPHMSEADDAPTYMKLGDYVERLDAYRARHRLEVETGVEVESVEQSGDNFVVRGNGHTWHGSHVVYAGGMLASPRLPGDFAEDGAQFAWSHSRDLREADVARGQDVLVIGGGNSAVEAVSMASERGAQVTLSLRGPMRSVPKMLLGVDLHYLAWLPEKLPVRFAVGARRFLTREPAFDLRRALRNTRARRVGAISHYGPRQVMLKDGTVLSPDRVVFATGYDYEARALGTLVERDASGAPTVLNCQSTRTPNLFILGLRFGRTLASHFLRGIALDAGFVAAQIEARQIEARQIEARR